MRSKGKMDLFEDFDFGEDTSVNEIEVDQDFARRFKHNNKREALQRYKELLKSGAISDPDEESSSDSEIEDIPKKKDLEFLDALSKVKNKDPILKNADVKLFESESESEDDENSGKRKEKKQKPMYLAQVIAEQLIKHGPEFVGSDDDGDDVVRKKVKTYDEEQEELVKAVLDAAKEVEEPDEKGLLREKIEVGDDKEKNDEEEQERIRMVDVVFEEPKDEGTIFLKEFFKNRMWVGKGEGGVNDVDLDEEDVDEEEIERQEAYERDFNFRFVEDADSRVMGHSRFVEGSVRKKDNKRKEEKERQKMRKDKIKFEMKEELKYLKNLKKKEILEKIQQVREVAGVGEDGDSFLDMSDLEGDFDPEAHDKKMSKAFNDEYYGAEDPQLGNDSDEDDDDEDDIEKPDFDKEDKLLGLPNDWDEYYESGKDKFDKEDNFLEPLNEGDEAKKSGGGFMEARQKVLKLKAEKGGVEAEAAVKEVRDKCMEEYYSLDYEDIVGGDVKTRFRYRPVKPKRFGLSDKDILVADNKLLNQLVPLKKIAPYRDQEFKVPRLKALQVKKQIWEIPNNRKQSDRGTGEKRKLVAENPEVGSSRDKEVNGDDDTSNLSRKAKRRRVQSGVKLPFDRLLAYGKIPSKPKSRKK